MTLEEALRTIRPVLESATSLYYGEPPEAPPFEQIPRLSTLLEANEVVREANEAANIPDGKTRTIHMTCADRLIAAYYCAVSYTPCFADEVEPTVRVQDAVVCVIRAPRPPTVDDEEVEREPEQSCRECGCTDMDCSDCIAKLGHPCSWVEHDLCSACAEAA